MPASCGRSAGVWDARLRAFLSHSIAGELSEFGARRHCCGRLNEGKQMTRSNAGIKFNYSLMQLGNVFQCFTVKYLITVYSLVTQVGHDANK